MAIRDQLQPPSARRWRDESPEGLAQGVVAGDPWAMTEAFHRLALAGATGFAEDADIDTYRAVWPVAPGLAADALADYGFPLNVGVWCFHPRLGSGRVQAVLNTGELVVDFVQAGKRRLWPFQARRVPDPERGHKDASECGRS